MLLYITPEPWSELVDLSSNSIIRNVRFKETFQQITAILIGGSGLGTDLRSILVTVRCIALSSRS